MTTHLHDHIIDFISAHHWLIIALVIIALIDGTLKLIAMWKASRNNEVGWFIVLAILNTIGILPVIYILMRKKKA